MFENHRSPVVGRAAIRTLNGPLADHLRSLKLPTGGAVWEHAKALAVAGWPVTREALNYPPIETTVETTAWVIAPAPDAVTVQPPTEVVDLSGDDVPFAQVPYRTNPFGRRITGPVAPLTEAGQRAARKAAEREPRVAVPRKRPANVAPLGDPRSLEEQVAMVEARLAQMPHVVAEREALLEMLLGHRPGSRVMDAAKRARKEGRALTLAQLLDADAYDAEAAERFAWR